MRLRRADLWRRVNGNLTFRFEHDGLTSYVGLEFVRRRWRRGARLAMSAQSRDVLISPK